MIVAATVEFAWKPTGKKLSYDPANEVVEAENLERVVKTCRVVRDFMDKLFRDAYPKEGFVVNLEVTRSLTGENLVLDSALSDPIKGHLERIHSFTRKTYRDEISPALQTILSNGRLQTADGTLPSTAGDPSDKLYLQISGAPEIKDTFRERKYVYTPEGVICSVTRSVYFVAPSSSRWLHFEVLDSSDSVIGQVHLVAEISFPTP